MKAKLLKAIMFAGKSLKEGVVYDVKELKGINPDYYEVISEKKKVVKEKPAKIVKKPIKKSKKKTK